MPSSTRAIAVSYADLKQTEKRAKKTIAKAKTKHSLQALDRLAEEVDGEYRIKSEPPLLVPLRESWPEVGRRGTLTKADQGRLRSLRRSGVSPDCRTLLR